MSFFLGIDTSNYTTSAAVFDGSGGENVGRLLDVPAGALGLRQSEALFQHVKRLPGLLHQLKERGLLRDIAAVAASTRPRAVEGSYMPCFLAGEGQGRALADALDVPFVPVSHQQGHLAAAAWSAGRMDLLDRPFLAWHLSGGTTELLLVSPEEGNLRAEKLGGTSDLSAGQLIDRTGQRLGLAFPSGKALEALYPAEGARAVFPVKLTDFTFSLSGMENQVKGLLERGGTPAEAARFTLDTLIDIILRTTRAAMADHPGLPVLCSGGVASNAQLREVLSRDCGALFAQPRYATDNAIGAAILAFRCGRGAAA